MSDFWQKLIMSLGGQAALFGLIIYLGKIHLERIGRNEQAAVDERLKRLEQDHEKRLTKGEHFHQISQQTNQNLFDIKIDAAKELSKLVANFEELIILNEDYPGSFKSTFFVRYLKICDYIRQKNLFFSSNLVRTNLKLYIGMREELQQYYIEKNSDRYDYANEDTSYQFAVDIKENQKFDEIYEKYEEDILHLIQIANAELELITDVINISLNTQAS